MQRSFHALSVQGLMAAPLRSYVDDIASVMTQHSLVAL